MGDKEDNTEGSSPYACVIKINTVKALQLWRNASKNERKTENCQKKA
jgi:hypothetical protein